METLNENEIWLRAVAFSEDWKDATDERREAQSFYNAFFKIFGLKRHQVARFEEHVERLGKGYGFIDLFWPGVLIVEHKSKGGNLDMAAEQVREYIEGIPVFTRPHYQLVSDFQRFRLLDINRGIETPFTLEQLPEKLELFDFMLDKSGTFYEEQKKLSIDASEMMGEIHKSLKKSKYDENDLEILLTRLTFCLFADNTGIFEKRLFQSLILDTRKDGGDTGQRVAKIFEVLNTPENKRQDHLESKLAKLRYVNGGLFEKPVHSADFNERMRFDLCEASKFDWEGISPAIFGSLFQSVMNEKKRREQGAHYTNELDILKVINPLFMDDLHDEFERIKKRKTAEERHALLKPFQDKLAEMKFFDPACGCGNFLVIAYRELRRLEIEILELLHTDSDDKLNKDVDINTLSKIDVHQFYGIELNDFAANIARSALWMMDHFMNRELSKVFGKMLLRFPLEKSPTIIFADALDTDWEKLLPPKDCNFIFGNPPFSGQSYQSKKQREQMRILTKPEGKNATPLDYVGAWFLKSAAYVRQADHNIAFAFVATNSITQGEQVAMLWQPLLHEHKLDIIFAHKTFQWESEASGKAHVHVVIIGLEKQEHARANRMLFSYEDSKGEPIGKSVLAISPYLFDATRLGNLTNPNLIIHSSSKPISPRAIMKFGIKPTDGGHYIFRSSDITAFTNKEPKAKKFMRSFIGAKELIHGKRRSILYLEHAKPNQLAKMPLVQKQIKLVEASRKASKKPATKKLALYPRLFEGRTIPTKPFLIIPKTSSELREYIPMAMFAPPVIPSDATRYIEDATPADFAMLNSAMHMAWVRTVTGRMKSDFSYTNEIVYNTFPLPLDKDLSKLAPFGQAILDARAENPDTTLATLYKSSSMPPNLRRAHEANDRAVDRLYSVQPFADDTARINHLFALYEKQTAQ